MFWECSICLFYTQAVRYLERMLVQAQRQKEQNKRTATEGCGGDQPEVIAGKEINIDPKTYCKLGHFHLLLEDYVKGTVLLFHVSQCQT
jgi:histone demethylase